MIYFVLLVILFAFAIMAKLLIDYKEVRTDVPIRRVDIPEENRERQRPMPHIDIEITRKLESEMTEQERMNAYKTRGLFLRTLKNIGCQYEKEENGNRIFFAYQGENFFVEVSDDRFYITVYDTHWGQVELYDIDEFTRLRKAINTANLNCATMVVYTIDDIAKTVDVHCKSTFPFLHQIPDLENYLRGELNDFFRAHQLVGNEMTKMREKEEALES